MLLLSRRVGESIMIGDEITLTVVSVKGSRVRLAFHAPRDLAIHRSELLRGNHTSRSEDISAAVTRHQR